MFVLSDQNEIFADGMLACLIDVSSAAIRLFFFSHVGQTLWLSLVIVVCVSDLSFD